MSKMLLGESQADLASAISEYFTQQNYAVQVETNGLRILECLRQDSYNVIVLEVILSGIDGIEVVSDYRSKNGATPIILLTNKYSSDELQHGLDSGADAYLVKPFTLSDLAAQLRALLRRPHLRNEKQIHCGNITLDSETGTVTKNNSPIHLFPMEFKLLQFLLINPNQVFSSHTLFKRVWQKEEGLIEDTVRTHVRSLRKKFDEAGHPSIITTVRGLGYKIDVESFQQMTRMIVASPLRRREESFV